MTELAPGPRRGWPGQSETRRWVRRGRHRARGTVREVRPAMHRPTGRPWVLIVIVAFLAACGESIAPVPNTLRDAPAGEGREILAERSASIDVAGFVAAANPSTVRLVAHDAKGRARESRADENGAFRFEALSLPYDLAAFTSNGAFAYLGLTLEDPHVDLAGAEAVRTLVRSVRVLVRLPRWERESTVIVATASTTGTGATSTAVPPGERTYLAVVDHFARSSSEPIHVSVLVADEAWARFAFAHRVAADVALLEHDPEVVSPEPVDATPPVSIAAGGTNHHEDWTWQMTVALELPFGGMMPLVEVDASELTMPLPNIAGAALRATATARAPWSGRESYVDRTLRVWSGRQSLGVDGLVLTACAGAEALRPSPSAVRVASEAEIEWMAYAPGLVTLAIRHGDEREPWWTIHTAEPSGSLARLEVLGFPALPPGPHTLTLGTRCGATLDDLLDRPRAEELAARTRPGSVTAERVEFVLGP